MFPVRQAMGLSVEIIMPGEKVEFLHVKSVVFQGAEGQVGILPGHIPLLSLMHAGVLHLTTEEGNPRFVTSEGLARISGDQVTFLVSDLIAEADIREDEALRSYESLSKAVNSLAVSGKEERMKELQFAKAQLDLLGIKPPH